MNHASRFYNEFQDEFLRKPFLSCFQFKEEDKVSVSSIEMMKDSKSVYRNDYIHECVFFLVSGSVTYHTTRCIKCKVHHVCDVKMLQIHMLKTWR